MKLKKVLLSFGFAATATYVVAAEPAPVIDISQTSSPYASGIGAGSIETRLANLEKQMQTRSRLQARAALILQELQTEVSELRGITETHEYKLNQVLQGQRDLYQEIERRIAELSQVAPASNTEQSAEQPDIAYSDNLSENESYDRAVKLVLNDKNYDAAIPEFKAFIKKYPKSTYSANANYWLGQLLYNKGQLKEAKQAFNVVVDNYKTSTKRSDAMLKSGMVDQKLNDLDAAKATYSKLIKEYPDSNAAKLAKARLDAIGK
ncbi:tol-pal system protein YbgF [Thalassotalea agarivorans]|uniref:Cell division coordinator CpoB n=1 Tax=Thalassotalea agarivorans TaxID=349064 RepID=A0A1I0GTW6_THASX|nr:tol-pal system protein YbgF [Thalassotalea agarivorans]SET74592.1 tol-pal system protein YbgF [Thalassotalea agarivorans]